MASMRLTSVSQELIDAILLYFARRIKCSLCLQNFRCSFYLESDKAWYVGHLFADWARSRGSKPAKMDVKNMTLSLTRRNSGAVYDIQGVKQRIWSRRTGKFKLLLRKVLSIEK